MGNSIGLLSTSTTNLLKVTIEYKETLYIKLESIVPTKSLAKTPFLSQESITSVSSFKKLIGPYFRWGLSIKTAGTTSIPIRVRNASPISPKMGPFGNRDFAEVEGL